MRIERDILWFESAMNRFAHPILLAVLSSVPLSAEAALAQAATDTGAGDPPAAIDTADRPSLAEATKGERVTIERMLQSGTWVRRAVVAMRLERFGCTESLEMLMRLKNDEAWQARAYAVRSLARRGVKGELEWFADEQDPRVVRTILRYRHPFALDRLDRGMRFLARSNDLQDKMLAAELGAASGDAELHELAKDTAKKVILRMSRTEAGALSPRLAVITGQPDMRRHYRWQDWLLKTGRRFDVVPAYAIAESQASFEPSLIATLPSERFAALEDYMAEMKTRKLDLAILLDCTASMWGEISEAQGGIDDMMLFVSDVVGELRIAIVGYRDRREDFETKAWDFTASLDEARSQLWQLTAEGGGDRREAVHDAMELAYTKLHWLRDSDKVLVLVGDAPPHVGLGAGCISMAGRAHRIAELITHAIQADGKDVEHFAEIAEAGGGKCVTLEEGDSLITEITGLTLGDTFQEEFREFFRVYLELCR